MINKILLFVNSIAMTLLVLWIVLCCFTYYYGLPIFRQQIVIFILLFMATIISRRK